MIQMPEKKKQGFVGSWPSFFLAKRYMRLRGADSFVSVVAGFSFVGLTLGVATLLVVMAVMNGFRQQLLDRILGANGHVSVFYRAALEECDVPDADLKIPNDPDFFQKESGAQQAQTESSVPTIPSYQKLRRKLQKIHSVQQVFPLIDKQVMVLAGTAAKGGLVRAFDPKDFSDRPFFKEGMLPGFEKELPEEGVLLGADLAKRLGVMPGEFVTLVAPQFSQTAFGSFPLTGRFRIAGLIKIGMSQYDGALVIMPLQKAQDFFGMAGQVSGFEIFGTSSEQVLSALPEIQSMALDHSAWAISWETMNADFFSVLQVERNVMFLILMLMILVAAFNIVACLVMLVKDKTVDIAILRSMGYQKSQVAGIFIWVGLLLGGGGTALGVLLGQCVIMHLETIRQFLERMTGARLFPPEFYFLSQMPAQLSYGDVALVAGAAIFFSLVATVYPAVRAARMQPHAALRFS